MPDVPALVDSRGQPLMRTKQEAGWYLPVSGGWLPPNAPANFWQCGIDPVPMTGSATVQACISCYSQTAAMCTPSHWLVQPDGGRKRITTSPLSRVLKSPNGYMSISDFMLNLVRELYEEGNAYAYARRDNRFAIYELHPFSSRSSQARVGQQGEIYYHLGGNEVAERLIGRDVLEAAPQRDVLHLRLNTRRNILSGEAPLTAALIEVATSNALVAQALAYVRNQGRPSGVLETEAEWLPEEIEATRTRWEEVTGGPNVGKTPILTHGLKWHTVSINSRDAQLAEILQISDQRVASVYRVPLALLSLLSGNGPQASTESLMSYWIATGFGFCLNHIEEGLGRLFQLAGGLEEYCEFDTSALLRSSFKDRLEALANAVRGGVYAPNEARAIEELPPAIEGDEPRVQLQVVPLSAWAQVQPSTPRPDAPPAQPPAPPTEQPQAANRDAIADAILRKAEMHGRRAA